MRIFVGNNELDLTGNERIQIKHQAAPVANALVPASSYSVEFEIPMTANNRSIFGFNDIITTDDDNIFSVYECRAENNGVDLRITSVEVTSFDPLRIRLYGGSAGLMEIIRDAKLSDLDLSDLDHTWDDTTITSSLTLTNYCYPIINYGPLVDDSNDVPVEYLYPAVYVDELVNRIVDDAGYTLSNELDADPHYTKLIIPFSNTRPKTMTDDEKANIGFEVYSTGQTITLLTETEMTFGVEVSDPGSHFATNRYTAPYDMYAGFYLKVSARSAVALTTTNVTFALYKYDGITDTLLNQATYLLTATYADVVVSEFQNQYHEIEAGDEVYITITPASQNVNIQGGVDAEGDGYSRWSLLSALDTMIIGWTWRVGINLPELTQAQLLTYVMRSFAGMLGVNEITKVVSIVTFDTVVANIATGKDWTDKVDLSIKPVKTFEYPESIGKITKLRYADDDNVIKPTGTDYEFTVGRKLEAEKILYEAPFAACESESKFTFAVPVVDIEVNGESEPKPRILLNRLRRYSTPLNFTLGGVTVDSDGVVNVPYFYDIANSHDLTWTKLRSNNLANYLTMLTKPRGLDIYIRLSDADINQLDHSVPVYLGTVGDEVYNAWFYVSEVNQNMNGSSLCKLNLLPNG